MSIRSFIAIELDKAIKGKLTRLQEDLRARAGLESEQIKWVGPDHMHLTLKFLGDVEDKYISDICAAVTAATEETEPFTFTIGKVGAFPERGSARVIWAGITEGIEELRELQDAVETSLEGFPLPREDRKFSPHLTLARIKEYGAGKDVARALALLEPLALGVQDVAGLTIFQSDLRRGGPIYAPLAHVNFA